MWALFDTKCPIGVLGIVIMLQLEGGRIVYKSLGALRDTCATIIEIHTGKAISVFRSGTASSAFPVAAVTDIGPIAPSITLLCTHCLR